MWLSVRRLIVAKDAQGTCMHPRPTIDDVRKDEQRHQANQDKRPCLSRRASSPSAPPLLLTASSPAGGAASLRRLGYALSVSTDAPLKVDRCERAGTASVHEPASPDASGQYAGWA